MNCRLVENVRGNGDRKDDFALFVFSLGMHCWPLLRDRIPAQLPSC